LRRLSRDGVRSCRGWLLCLLTRVASPALPAAHLRASPVPLLPENAGIAHSHSFHGSNRRLLAARHAAPPLQAGPYCLQPSRYGLVFSAGTFCMPGGRRPAGRTSLLGARCARGVAAFSSWASRLYPVTRRLRWDRRWEPCLALSSLTPPKVARFDWACAAAGCALRSSGVHLKQAGLGVRQAWAALAWLLATAFSTRAARGSATWRYNTGRT